MAPEVSQLNLLQSHAFDVEFPLSGNCRGGACAFILCLAGCKAGAAAGATCSAQLVFLEATCSAQQGALHTAGYCSTSFVVL